MSTSRSISPISLDAVRRIDEACDQFEEDLRRGDRPRIEAYLDAEAPETRSALLQALLEVELEYRRAWGERPQIDEYLARFVDHHDAVQAAFANEAPPPDLCSQDLCLLQMALANASGRRTDRLRIYYQGELVYTTIVMGPVELGRQRQGEAGPYTTVEVPEGNRVIVAPLEETTVSRHHAFLMPDGDNAIRITNLSHVNPIIFPNGRRLKTNQSDVFPLMVEMSLGAVFVRIDRPLDVDGLGDTGEPSFREKAPTGPRETETRNFFDLFWGWRRERTR